MEDNLIVDLYWARSENAIAETAAKYGRYCYSIAYNILTNVEDANEAVNDTWLGAWNSIPPHRPSVLSTFLGKITRRVSINKWDERNAKKRGAGEIALALDELVDCVPSSQNVERTIERKELTRAINAFLAQLSETERDIFVCRYWFMSSIKEISANFKISESNAKTSLFRTRKKLYSYLQEEGY